MVHVLLGAPCRPCRPEVAKYVGSCLLRGNSPAFKSRVELRTNPDVLDAELKWAAGRPCSKWKSSGKPTPSMEDGDVDVFTETLTANEAAFYETYQHKQPGALYSLNQDPAVTCMTSSGQARD